jgi:hypothetical protein
MTKSRLPVDPSDEDLDDEEDALTRIRRRKSRRLHRSDSEPPDLEDFAPESRLTKKDLDWLL